MASAEQVEQSLQHLVHNLASASPEPGTLPDRTILCVVSDHDTIYRAELRESKLKGLKKVREVTEADVRITATSDDIVSLVAGRLSIASAVLTGRIRIDASTRDLMLLRRLL